MKRFFMYADIRALKLFVALNSISIGFMFHFADQLFNRQSFSIMAHMAPRETWATAFVVHGAVMLLSLTITNWQRLRKDEYLGIFLLAPALGLVLWCGSLLALFFSIYPPPTATGLTTGTTLAMIWIFIRWEGRTDGT